MALAVALSVNGHSGSERFLAKLTTGRTPERYHAKQVIFTQGDPANTVFYIQRGKVTVNVISSQGKEAVISILGESDFLGAECLAGETLRAVTATTITRCLLLKLEKNAMLRMLRAEPAFSEHFISYLLARTSRIQEHLVDQLFNSSEKRLARVLLLLARFDQNGGSETVVPKLSQQILADMIGTTRSRVSYFMNKFRKQGLIDYSNELRIRTSLLDTFLHE